MKRQNGIEIEIFLIMAAFTFSIVSYKILTILGLQHSEATEDFKEISFDNLFLSLFKIVFIEELIYRFFPFVFAYLTKNKAVFTIVAIVSSMIFGYNHGGFWNIINSRASGTSFILYIL